MKPYQPQALELWLSEVLPIIDEHERMFVTVSEDRANEIAEIKQRFELVLEQDAGEFLRPPEDSWEQTHDEIDNYAARWGMTDQDVFLAWRIGVAAWRAAKNLGGKFPSDTE